MRCWLPEYIATLKKKGLAAPARSDDKNPHSSFDMHGSFGQKKNIHAVLWISRLLVRFVTQQIYSSFNGFRFDEFWNHESAVAPVNRLTFSVKKEKFEAEITYFFRPRCSCVHFLTSIDNCIDYSTELAGLTLTICIDRRRAPELPSFKTLLRSTGATYWSTSGYDFLLWCFIKA